MPGIAALFCLAASISGKLERSPTGGFREAVRAIGCSDLPYMQNIQCVSPLHLWSKQTQPTISGAIVVNAGERRLTKLGLEWFLRPSTVSPALVCPTQKSILA